MICGPSQANIDYVICKVKMMDIKQTYVCLYLEGRTFCYCLTNKNAIQNFEIPKFIAIINPTDFALIYFMSDMPHSEIK